MASQSAASCGGLGIGRGLGKELEHRAQTRAETRTEILSRSTIAKLFSIRAVVVCWSLCIVVVFHYLRFIPAVLLKRSSAPCLLNRWPADGRKPHTAQGRCLIDFGSTSSVSILGTLISIGRTKLPDSRSPISIGTVPRRTEILEGNKVEPKFLPLGVETSTRDSISFFFPDLPRRRVCVFRSKSEE